jgi:hypothetical protein
MTTQHCQKYTRGVFESPFLTTLELTRHENGGLERQEPTRENAFADPGFHSPLVGGLDERRSRVTRVLSRTGIRKRPWYFQPTTSNTTSLIGVFLRRFWLSSKRVPVVIDRCWTGSWHGDQPWWLYPRNILLPILANFLGCQSGFLLMCRGRTNKNRCRGKMKKETLDKKTHCEQLILLWILDYFLSVNSRFLLPGQTSVSLWLLQEFS